jgi:hypothetical protein
VVVWLLACGSFLLAHWPILLSFFFTVPLHLISIITLQTNKRASPFLKLFFFCYFLFAVVHYRAGKKGNRRVIALKSTTTERRTYTAATAAENGGPILSAAVHDDR